MDRKYKHIHIQLSNGHDKPESGHHRLKVIRLSIPTTIFSQDIKKLKIRNGLDKNAGINLYFKVFIYSLKVCLR